MIDTPGKNDRETKKKETLQKYIDMIKKDSVDEKTYEEIYAMIPEKYIVEKDKDMNDPKEFAINRKTTKRKLNKTADKVIIDKLKIFAQEKKLGLGNQLAFNDHFDDMFIWTIYFTND